jgi:hypothetical protein
MGYFDRGGSMVIFGAASCGGLVGAVIVGPRYFMAISKSARHKIQEGAT